MAIELNTQVGAAPMLWFDETCYLDNDSSTAYANQWVLPPEKYLRLGNAVQLQFFIDYSAVGPSVSGSNIQVALEHSSAPTDLDDAFDTITSNVTLSREREATSALVGDDGSPNDPYPRGFARIKITNDDSGSTGWAAVRMRVLVRVVQAEV